MWQTSNHNQARDKEQPPPCGHLFLQPLAQSDDYLDKERTIKEAINDQQRQSRLERPEYLDENVAFRWRRVGPRFD
jgi:hypothetical protein